MFLSHSLYEFPCLQIWHSQWDHLYLLSLSQNPQKAQMASRNDQVVPATKVKNKNILAASGDTSGITTRSKAKALFAATSTPALTLPKGQEHPRHEPVITLASVRALREESPRKYSESLLSDADSSSSLAMQVMTTWTTSIEEQLTQMNEAIAKLTRTVEEKDLQIAALANQLVAQHDMKVDLKVGLLKKEADEEENPPMEKVKEKLEPDQAAALMGSLSIQQLHEMIANTIKKQYEGELAYLCVVLKALLQEDWLPEDAEGLSTTKVHAVWWKGKPKAARRPFRWNLQQRMDRMRLPREAVCPLSERDCIRLVHGPRAWIHQQLGAIGAGIPQLFLQHPPHYKHARADKHEAMEELANRGLHQPMAHSKPRLQRQALRDLLDRDVRP